MNTPESNDQDNREVSNKQESEYNPYATPNMRTMVQESTMLDNGHFGLLVEPRKCDAGRGLTWFTSAFVIFKNNWLMWLGMGFIFLAILMLLSFIPLLNILVNFVMFHFVGGFMLIAAKQEEGLEISFGDMFLAFQTHFAPLLILGLIYLLLVMVVFIPMIAVIFMMFGASAFTSDNFDLFSNGSSLIMSIGFLISLGLLVPLVMSIYLAPALIVLHDKAPIEAMKMSFKGCLKNVIPFLLLGIVIMIIMPILTLFTLGLGIFIISPVMMISYYTCYRDIWSKRMIGDF